VTRKGNDTCVDMHVLEHCVRKDLDNHAPRTLAVIEPVLATIVNVAENFEEKIKVNLFPKNPEKGQYEITLRKRIYLDL
jgi:glutaminyl-tRNA synthetase